MTFNPYHVQCDGPCGRNDLDERHETVWSFVHGWEKKREQGGLNHLACRRPQDVYRCDACMKKVLDGVSIAQETLAV